MEFTDTVYEGSLRSFVVRRWIDYTEVHLLDDRKVCLVIWDNCIILDESGSTLKFEGFTLDDLKQVVKFKNIRKIFTL